MFVRKWSSARTGIKLSGKTASVQRQTFKYIQKSLTTIAEDQSLAPWKKNTKKWEVAKDFCTALYYGCLLSFLLFCSPMANNIWFHMLSSYTVWILSVLTICCVHSRVAGNHFKSNSCFLSGNLLKKLETCQCCIYSECCYWHHAKELIYLTWKHIIIHESPLTAKISDRPKS